MLTGQNFSHALKRNCTTLNLSPFVNTKWQWGIFHCFEFVCAWFYALFCQTDQGTTLSCFQRRTFIFILMWCCTSLFNTWFKVVRCSSWVAECTNRSLMYTMTLEMLFTTVSMRHWKLARQPSRPKGLVTHWNCPMPGTVKAVYGLALGCKIICQKPTVRSMILKIVLPDHPILPMHLLTSFMEYLSLLDCWLKAPKSWTRCMLPSFFMTAKIRLLYLLRAG